MPTPASPEPYQDDLAHLEAEMGWVDTRCRRILVEQLIRGTRLELEDDGYRKSDIEPRVLQERLRHLQDQEHQLRQDIDRRLVASEAAGLTPALIRMQDTWELNELERLALLLALGAQLRPDLDDAYRRLGESAYLSVQTIFEFTGLALRERVQERHLFLEEGALSVLGLVEIRAGTPEPTMEDTLGAMVMLTSKGFSLMLGEVSLDAEVEADTEPEPEVDGQKAEVRRPRRTRDGRDRHGDHEEVKGGCQFTIPETRLADVVLPGQLAAMVEELLAAARHRHRILADWGIGKSTDYGKGISALLFGSPGTGKTFTAHAIAGELGRPLILASAPQLISAWVGQSAQNYTALFSQARDEEAVLLLDECDSLLGQRGAGMPSRHDDGLTNTLLHLLEAHDGLVLLASNLPDRLDGAVGRRLTYQLEFPEPDANTRATLWRTMIPERAPTGGELDFTVLGEGYQLSGGRIRNAIQRAAFRAARSGSSITQALLTTAAAEEVAAQAGALGSRVRVVGFGR